MTHTEDGDALVVIESGNGTGDVARHDGDDGGRHEASAGGKEVWNSLGKNERLRILADIATY